MVHKSTRLCILIFIFSCTGTVLYANSTVPYAFFLIMHRYTCIPCTQSALCVTMIFVSISTQGDLSTTSPLNLNLFFPVLSEKDRFWHMAHIKCRDLVLLVWNCAHQTARDSLCQVRATRPHREKLSTTHRKEMQRGTVCSLWNTRQRHVERRRGQLISIS